MIRVDGSLGEGGGQVLRSSLSLSLTTGAAVRIENIRAGRERQGLLRQHLTAVLAAAEVGGAQVEGASLGSKTLTFTPGEVRPGKYRFVIGTAGSGTLVLQTILPALLNASGPSEVTIEGGTHNHLAPPFDYLERVFLPLIRRMGPKVEVRLQRFGFYPAGGGSFEARIEPCATLSPVDLLERGEITGKTASAIVANLPRHVAERELAVVRERLGWDGQAMNAIETRNSVGPGNIVMIEIVSACLTEIFSAFGKVGKSAESVASEACGTALAYLASGAAAGEHLADQLLLPFALAGGGAFTAEKLNLHARTNMEVIGKFLPVEFLESEEGTAVRVEVRPRAR